MIAPYQITTAVLGVAIAGFILILVRRNLLYTRFSIWWLLVACAVFIFGLFPRLSDIIARFFGVSYGPSLLFLLALGFIFIKMLTMDMERSSHEVKIRRLVQKVAMMERNMVEMEKRLHTRDRKGS